MVVCRYLLLTSKSFYVRFKPQELNNNQKGRELTPLEPSPQRRRAMRMGLVFAVVVACAACEGSPSAPSPTPAEKPALAVDPIPADARAFSLPDAREPLSIWITQISPAKGSAVSTGQTVTLTWRCTGPAEYSAAISVRFVGPGLTPVQINRVGGSVVNLAHNCSWTVNLEQATVVPGVTIEEALFRVWIQRGEFTAFGNREPDFMFTEQLGWVSE